MARRKTREETSMGAIFGSRLLPPSNWGDEDVLERPKKVKKSKNKSGYNMTTNINPKRITCIPVGDDEYMEIPNFKKRIIAHPQMSKYGKFKIK